MYCHWTEYHILDFYRSIIIPMTMTKLEQKFKDFETWIELAEEPAEQNV